MCVLCYLLEVGMNKPSKMMIRYDEWRKSTTKKRIENLLHLLLFNKMNTDYEYYISFIPTQKIKKIVTNNLFIYLCSKQLILIPMKKNLSLLIIILLLSFKANSQTNNDLPIIPYPQQINIGSGQFSITANTQIKPDKKGLFYNEVTFLQSILSKALGHNLSTEQGDNTIEFIYSDKISDEEAYSLDVTPTQITITAGTPAGAFYAVQTIRQLLPASIEKGKVVPEPLTLPTLSIKDNPAFKWRGSMIDVSRHFFSLEYLKKHIDRLALYKMNKLHIHLTDDQGWRIEIKKHPKLTEQGAWRTFNKHDSICMENAKENPDFEIDKRYVIEHDGKTLYGGYFRQGELKDLIAYAQKRHIEIIPEIDMPGHMMAAINTYPYLTDSEYKGWGKTFSTPLCPCKEEVYQFLEDVLSEVIDIFPSQYIHIGADEVEKDTWEKSELCKQLMEKEGIKDVKELQSYFVHRIQDFVESKGKKIIGWDEVLDGGINSNVSIMYWRGWVAGAPKKAAINGNKIIMSPTNPLYFDFLPNKSSLYNVYHMDVIYDDIPEDKRHLIQGAQANLWAEKIPGEKRSEFLLFPRLTALAERVWTNKELFNSYSDRLLNHFSRLDAMGVNYRLPDVEGFAQESVIAGKTFFDVKSPLSNMNIHYTMDGSVPSTSSPMLDKPLEITKPVQVKFALFSPGNVRGEIYTINYRESKMNKAVKAKNLKDGLTCDFYKLRIDKTTKIKGEPTKSFVVNNFTVPAEAKAPSFGLKYNGYINVPETGVYSFYFTCDDSGILYIDDQVIIDNEGPHSPVEKSGQAALAKGLHPIRLDFVEAGGGYTLRIKYSVNGSEVKDIPDSWFVH